MYVKCKGTLTQRSDAYWLHSVDVKMEIPYIIIYKRIYSLKRSLEIFYKIH